MRKYFTCRKRDVSTVVVAGASEHADQPPPLFLSEQRAAATQRRTAYSCQLAAEPPEHRVVMTAGLPWKA